MFLTPCFGIHPRTSAVFLSLLIRRNLGFSLRKDLILVILPVAAGFLAAIRVLAPIGAHVFAVLRSLLVYGFGHPIRLPDQRNTLKVW
jgi:hypothetical protein